MSSKLFKTYVKFYVKVTETYALVVIAIRRKKILSYSQKYFNTVYKEEFKREYSDHHVIFTYFLCSDIYNIIRFFFCFIVLTFFPFAYH